MEMERSIARRQNNTLVSIFVFAFIDLLVSALFSSLSIFILGALGTLAIFLLRPELDRRSLQLFIFIKIASVLAVLLSYYNCEALFSKPYYIGGSDDLHSETDAYDFVKLNYNWPWEWPLFVDDKGFIWILAKLISLAGVSDYHTVAFRIFNEDFLIATAVLCYRLSHYRLGLDKKQATMVLAVVALFPNSLYLSSFVFRDTICAFLMLLVFVLCDDILKKKEQAILISKSKIVNLFLLAADLFLTFWIRPEALLFEIVIIGFSILRDNTIKGRNVVYLLFSFVVVFYIFNAIGAIDTVNNTINAYSELRLDETDNSNNAVFKLIFILPLIPFGIILRGLWGFISPLPTQLVNFFTMLTRPTDIFGAIVALGMIPYYLYIPFFFKSIFKIDKYLLTFLMIFGGYIISTFTFRHVLLFYPYLWIILFRNYYHTSIIERKILKKYSLIMVLMLPILYIITKML